jgi:hypothetical protein
MMKDVRGMVGMVDPSAWESCRIERVIRRTHWYSRKRHGIFVALVRATLGYRIVARSASFLVSSRTDADIPAFNSLFARLVEEGWQPWQGPDVPIGIGDLNRGYWSRTLHHSVGLPRAENATTERVRDAGERSMETLRDRAIERLRQEGYQI